MGCDIHLYIEYKSKKTEFDGYKHKWQGFGGRINPGRNYAMFALMAGIRNYYDKLPVLVEPRGMPADVGYDANDDNQLYISDTSAEDGYVTPERAKRWVDSGTSKYINGQDGKPIWVTNPDWHTHSWLTTNEFESIFNKYLELETGWNKKSVDEHNEYVKKENIQPDSWMYDPPSMNDEPEYQVVLASLKRFEELGYDDRIVFWFDN